MYKRIEMRTYATSCRCGCTEVAWPLPYRIHEFGFFAITLALDPKHFANGVVVHTIDMRYLQCRYACSGHNFFIFENVI